MICSRTICFALVVAGLLAVVTLGKAQEREKGTTYTIDDPRSTHAIVARVGPLEISAQQFLLSYELGPAFVKKEKDSKQHLLDFMINEKLLALDAYARSQVTFPRIAATLAELLGDLATEELYKADVLSKVRVTDREIARGIQESKRTVNLRWVFAPTREAAEAQLARLKSGLAFDSLYESQGPDSVLAANRSLQSNLFRLRYLNRDIASVADTLHPYRVSAPLKGPDGWYLLQTAGGTRDLLSTQSDEEKMYNDVYRVLLQQKADSVSTLYVNRLMSAHKPVIVKGTFGVLSRYLAGFFLDYGVANAWGFLPPVTDSVINRAGTRALVTLSKGDRIRLEEFMRWYRTRETLIKLEKGSKEAFLYSAEQLIWRMVRDHLLVERAFARNFQNREQVKLQKRWWEEKLMYEAEKRSIVDSISLGDNLLRRYFEEHRSHYRDDKGKPLEFDSAREDVVRDYYELEITKRMLHKIIALKRTYPVSVNNDVLSGIHVEENQPRAIDVYAVKKGGTFPRPAFPTIDLLWQTWN